MSGFKRTIQELNPAGFWTFDGEPVAPSTRLYTHTPLTVFDESNVYNDGTMMADSTEYEHSYRAGTGSLVSLELAQQASLCFGYYGKYNGTYPKSFVYVPNIALYDTRANFGSFTLIFLFEKTADEAVFRNAEYPSYYGWDLTRPIINKPGLINIYLYDSYYYDDYLVFSFPNGVLNVYNATISLYGKKHFVAAKWDCVQTGDPLSPYRGTASVLIDGVTVATRTTTYADTPPGTYVNSTFEIGGSSSASASGFGDRATSATYIDQVAYFTKALSQTNIFRLYKKCFSYEDLILRRGPYLYLPFSDNSATITNTVVPLAGNNWSTVYGPVAKEQVGPISIPSARAFLFADGMVNHRSPSYTYYNGPSLDVNNYSIMLWAKIGGNQRSVIFSMQSETSPFAGPLIELNVGNGGQFLNGGIQFSESESAWVSTPPGMLFNEGTWILIVAQRRGDILELYVNGELLASKSYTRQGINGLFNSINLMGVAPGKLYTGGFLSHFALFSGKTMEAAEIAMFHTYTRIYRARGSTTLRGAPYSARVRLYSYRTGELKQQDDSDPSTGEYTFYLDNNELLTTQVLSMNDHNVRVRGYGPITPGEMEDLP